MFPCVCVCACARVYLVNLPWTRCLSVLGGRHPPEGSGRPGPRPGAVPGAGRGPSEAGAQRGASGTRMRRMRGASGDRTGGAAACGYWVVEEEEERCSGEETDEASRASGICRRWLRRTLFPPSCGPKDFDIGLQTWVSWLQR